MASVITQANFENEVLKSEIPVIVDFYADWCGPCKMVAPSIEELSRELSGKVKVFKLNIDGDGELAEKYGVSAIPTISLFKNGEIAETITGAAAKDVILGTFEKHWD